LGNPGIPVFVAEVQIGTEVPNMSIVGIIGSGGMAAAIGGLAGKAGHTVEVTSRDVAKARALAEQIGAGATTGTFGAAPAGTSSSWLFPTQPFSTW
jgi:shikimate 5-dehydrogenase